MNIPEYFDKTLVVHEYPDFTCQDIRPRIYCKDGSSLSVQGSHTHYCTPRIDRINYYSSVEVGYPSIVPPANWEEYCEQWENPTDTVYGYVPVDMVEAFIQDHGGIDEETTFAKAAEYQAKKKVAGN
jgi:hypothetical protein